MPRPNARGMEIRIKEYKTCNDCSQCRRDKEDGWYCRRTYTAINPEDFACDDFEENDR